MKRRFVYDPESKEMVEVSQDYQQSPTADHHIIGDIEPYRSMIDGTMITSRSKHRAHLKQHNCIEVGNDPSVLNPVSKPIPPPPGLRETIAREVYDKLRYK